MASKIRTEASSKLSLCHRQCDTHCVCAACCMQVGKLIYCTRTVPEMEKVLAELQVRAAALDCADL